MVSPVAQIESLYKCLEKARQLVAEGKVHPVVGMDGHYVVLGTAGYYMVNGVCTCPDARERADIHKSWCKHKLAVELHKDTPQELAENPKGRKGRAAATGDAPSDEELGNL